jgi:hypothetical protein
MAFFDKQQDVIDIKLTHFGRNLLARGFFKPVYYRFFDDDVLYNPESAGFTEEQKRSGERIDEAPRPKTQYSVIGPETRFDQNQNLINSGNLPTFIEIDRRQDPLVAEKILKYPLENSRINSTAAPYFALSALEAEISSSADTITILSSSLPIPQINISSSYRLLEDRRSEVEINLEEIETQGYMDLLTDRIEFLNKTSIQKIEENIIIDLEEINVDNLLENFDIEIYEIDGNGKHIRLESEEQVKKYFNIEVDDRIGILAPSDVRNDRFYREQ